MERNFTTTENFSSRLNGMKADTSSSKITIIRTEYNKNDKPHTKQPEIWIPKVPKELPIVVDNRPAIERAKSLLRVRIKKDQKLDPVQAAFALSRQNSLSKRGLAKRKQSRADSVELPVSSLADGDAQRSKFKMFDFMTTTGLEDDQYEKTVREVFSLSRNNHDSYEGSIYDLDRAHKTRMMKNLRPSYNKERFYILEKSGVTRQVPCT